MKNKTDIESLKLLYQLSNGQPYRIGASHVVPDSIFNPVYPSLSNQKFVLTTIPQYKK